MNQEKYVATGIKLVKGLDDYSQQRLFLKTLSKGFCDKKRLQWLEWTCHTLYQETRWNEDRPLDGRDVQKRHEENPWDDSFNVCQLLPYEHKDVSVPDKMARRVKCRDKFSKARNCQGEGRIGRRTEEA